MRRHWLNPNQDIYIKKIESNSKRWKDTKFEGEAPKDLAELVFRLIVKKEKTVFVDGGIQCTKGRKRSIEDLFRLARYYNKDIQLKDITKVGRLLRSSRSIGCSYCTVVERWVYESSLTIDCFLIRSRLGDLNIKFGR